MDIEALLAPISEAQPCGEDFSLSPEVDIIQNMRREDDPSLAQGEWVTSLKVADWPGVQRACEALLHNKTKDLRIAGWLIEAQARNESFQGLAHGLTLCAQLIDRYWSDIHPQAEDGDQEERIGNLHWLVVRVKELARQIPLVIVKSRIGHNLIEIEAARSRRIAGTPDGEGLASLETINKALQNTGLSAYQAQHEHVVHSRQALQALQTEIDARLGADGPSFVEARTVLEQAQQTLEKLAQETGFSACGMVTISGNTDDATGNAAAPTGQPEQSFSQVIQTRTQALEQLRRVADFFRQTEPHSPVAYLADKAARWGNMPLHEWLRTELKDESSISRMEDILGIQRELPQE